MKLKIKTNSNNYSVIIGKNICSKINKLILNERIYSQKFLLVYDSKIPTQMVKSIIGKPAFGPTQSEGSSLIGRRSLYVVNKIKKGEEFSRINLKSIRPGNGLKPKLIKTIFGLKASRDIDFGEPLDFSMIENYIN